MQGEKKLEKIMWHTLPFAALAVWGMLCATNQLWYDEAYSVGLVMQPWLKMIYITAVDAHSPFYYALLKLFYFLCGGGTHFQSLKLFSLLFMIGYMLLGKYYVKKLFGREISVWFMLCSLLMPIMSVQAGNVRMYAMALFFMTLTGCSACDIFRVASRKKWCIFCLASICTMYCHTFAMIQTFWIYILFLAALLVTRQYRKFRGGILSGLVAAAFFSPWLFVTFKQMSLRMYDSNGFVGNYAKISAFMDYCKEWFSAVETPIGFVVFLGMAMAVTLGYLAVDHMRDDGDYTPALGMAAFGLTVLTGGLVSAYINDCFLGRYAFPGFGFCMLFYAFGISRLKSGKSRVCVLAALFCCFALQYRSELQLEYDGGLKKYEQFVAEHVQQGDVIVAPNIHAAFLSVYHPELQYRLDGYVENKSPFPHLESCYDVALLLEEADNVWYIASPGTLPGDASLICEKMMGFHYMYYDFVVYRLAKESG